MKTSKNNRNAYKVLALRYMSLYSFSESKKMSFYAESSKRPNDPLIRREQTQANTQDHKNMTKIHMKLHSFPYMVTIQLLGDF